MINFCFRMKIFVLVSIFVLATAKGNAYFFVSNNLLIVFNWNSKTMCFMLELTDKRINFNYSTRVSDRHDTTIIWFQNFDQEIWQNSSKAVFLLIRWYLIEFNT